MATKMPNPLQDERGKNSKMYYKHKKPPAAGTNSTEDANDPQASGTNSTNGTSSCVAGTNSTNDANDPEASGANSTNGTINADMATTNDYDD